MGLSSFPSASEGMLPILVMNTVMSVAILKKLIRSFLELVGATNWASTNFDESPTTTTSSNDPCTCNNSRRRRVRGISIIKFKSSNFALVDEQQQQQPTTKNTTTTTKTSFVVECCVCLSKFKDDEEVSELSCKHFFHKKCLDKWFDNHHSTCPLCRSIH